MNTQEMIEDTEEEQPKEELESNEDPLGLDNMFGQNNNSKDSGLMEMPMMDLNLGF